MEQVMPLPDLDREIAGWKGEVNEIRNELNKLNDRLGKVAVHHVSRTGSAQVEHFQNQFICKKEAADELYKELKRAGKKLGNDSAAGLQDEEILRTYDHLNERFQSFNRLFGHLRSEFESFAGEN
jgi:hypothetical protein